MKDENLKARLHTLSPIHIGSGEEYDFTNFVIDDNSCRLIEFDPAEFVGRLQDKEKAELNSICEEGSVESILKLYRFIYSKRNIVYGKEVGISKDVVERYKRILNMSYDEFRKELNRFYIRKTVVNPNTLEPYIPGSSIKGSMRTAYLNRLAKERNISLDKEQGDKKKMCRILENSLLDINDGFHKDPFRLLKISDFTPVRDVRRRIIYEVNIRKEGGRYRMPLPVEVIIQDAVFEGSIRVMYRWPDCEIRQPIRFDSLVESMRSFYGKVLDEENRVLKRLGISPVIPLNRGKGFLMRIGRHSGAEAVTIEGYRSIKIKGRGSPSKRATTIWLASESRNPRNGRGLKPFGWVWIELIS